MPGRTINVVVPHSLGIEVAKVRLRNAVDDQRHSDPNIQVTDFAWHDSMHTFTLDCLGYGAKVHAAIVIASDKVTVTTDPIAGFWPIVAAAVWRAESQIKTMLSEALK